MVEEIRKTEEAEGANKGSIEQPRKRRRRLPLVPLVILGIFVIMAIFAPFLAPHSPTDQNLRDRLMPPAWDGDGNTDHLLGTDQLGRDILSRIIYGTQTVFKVSLACLAIGGGIGGLAGLLAGYKGGWLDTIIMRVADANIAFPVILLAMLLVLTMGAGLGTVILAMSLVVWAPFARLTRGEVLSIRERDWVTQARINGCSDVRIIFRHVAPHVLNTWVVVLTLQMGFIILFEAGLSFLGAGVPPPTPTWGRMVSDGRDVVSEAWWVPIMPGLAIALLVLSFNMLGDWLREVLDPKLRQV